MSAALVPVQLVREGACCGALGLLAGALRALAPAKGRAAFLPDVLLTGTLLVLLQAYAAAYSAAGTLRWYMALAGVLGALLAHGVLCAPLHAARRALAWLAAQPVRFLRQRLLRPALKMHRMHVQQAKERRNEKKTAKKWKKNLQKHRHLLYNSNV